MAAVTPVDLQKSLSGVDYPASKQDLIGHAIGQGAEDSILEVLERLPEREYDGPDDVSKAAFDES